MLREIDKNFEVFKQRYDKIELGCEYLLDVINGKEKFELGKFVDKLIEIQPFSTLGNLIGKNLEVTSDRIKRILMDHRYKYDKIIYISTDYMASKLLETLPDKYKEYISVMTLDELKNINQTDINVLEKRKNGYIYYDGKIELKSMSEFCKEKGFIIKSDVLEENIKGDVAYGGIIKGTVKIILNSKDFDKFKEDDILVTSMTTPKFTSIMKKASGIITDEGGVTCHASIIARELKKPCIVGCKNATKILKDNMKIELDAISGVVRIED